MEGYLIIDSEGGKASSLACKLCVCDGAGGGGTSRQSQLIE